MKKQITAVEWLKNELWEKFNFSFSDNIFKQAKEMEKQKIIDAYTIGNRLEFYDASETIGKQYYNETYGSK